MNRLFITTGLILFLFSAVTSAQDSTEIKQQNIFESLAIPDSGTKAKVVVHQDERIEQLFSSKKNTKGFQGRPTFSGYRVQVFSSNTQRTAKNEAFKVEKQIRDLFPNEEVYVNYTSPFWKVRVGDFNSMEKAQAFRAEIIDAFPQIKSETYIVKEQINYTGSK
ncbi:MAG: SPOR domain-containing protein [Paludibacter sp.]|nr:SPOR domain-containing protein [Paludibacter sp.]